MIGTVQAPAPPMQYRLLIFVGVVLGAILQVLDTTMATVALPRIQGALSATQDEIAWVLASYLIAVAIFMPLVRTLLATPLIAGDLPSTYSASAKFLQII